VPVITREHANLGDPASSPMSHHGSIKRRRM
jgi:hypothetical protein